MAQVPFPNAVTPAQLLSILQQYATIFNQGVNLVAPTTNNFTGYTADNVNSWATVINTPAIGNTEFAINHGLARIPNGYIILWKSSVGDFYQGPTTGTPWTSAAGAANGRIYLKCTGSALTALILIV